MTESDSIDSLQSASLDMDVDVHDTIMISGHCMQLDCYSIWAMWGSHDLIFSHAYAHNSFLFFKCLLFPKKFPNNMRVPCLDYSMIHECCIDIQ